MQHKQNMNMNKNLFWLFSVCWLWHWRCFSSFCTNLKTSIRASRGPFIFRLMSVTWKSCCTIFRKTWRPYRVTMQTHPQRASVRSCVGFMPLFLWHFSLISAPPGSYPLSQPHVRLSWPMDCMHKSAAVPRRHVQLLSGRTVQGWEVWRQRRETDKEKRRWRLEEERLCSIAVQKTRLRSLSSSQQVCFRWTISFLSESICLIIFPWSNIIQNENEQMIWFTGFTDQHLQLFKGPLRFVCACVCVCVLLIFHVCVAHGLESTAVFSAGDNRISLVSTKCSSVKLNQLELCRLWAEFGCCDCSSVCESQGDTLGHGASHQTPWDEKRWDYISSRWDYSLSNLLLIHFAIS